MGAMPKISEAAFHQRRARIMDAARKSFSLHGIHVSVDDICRQAGVSKGALYGYFPSKDAIVQAIADEHAADFAAIRAATDPAALQAALLARAWQGDSGGFRLELEAWTYSLNNEALRNRLLANAADLRASIAEALQGMQASGAIELHGPADAAAAVIETFIIGAVAKGALGGGADSRETATHLRTLILALMRLAAPSD